MLKSLNFAFVLFVRVKIVVLCEAEILKWWLNNQLIFIKNVECLTRNRCGIGFVYKKSCMGSILVF